MYKIFDRRTCGLSHQIKGPVIVNLTILQLKPDLANFTVVGPLIWCDNPHVRMSKILYINNNDFHNLGRSQMCAGGCCYFRPSKPHSGTLCPIIERLEPRNKYLSHVFPVIDGISHLCDCVEMSLNINVIIPVVTQRSPSPAPAAPPAASTHINKISPLFWSKNHQFSIFT